MESTTPTTAAGVQLHARLERVLADVALQHTNHSRALLVAQRVEHLVDEFGVIDGDFDGVGRQHAVRSHRVRRLRANKLLPDLPLRELEVDRQPAGPGR